MSSGSSPDDEELSLPKQKQSGSGPPSPTSRRRSHLQGLAAKCREITSAHRNGQSGAVYSVDVDSIMIVLSSVLPPSPSGINHLLCGGCNYVGQHLTAWLNLFFPPPLPVLVLACHTSLILLFTPAISGTLSAVSFGIEAAKQSEADCRS